VCIGALSGAADGPLKTILGVVTRLAWIGLPVTVYYNV
jgi:hypothetical protein